MKLVSFVMAATLALTGALTGTARADDFAPEPRPRHRQQLRQLLLERFDRNGDGRLEPRERRHAIRALRKLERRLARADGQQARGDRMQRLIRKYDLNGDGNVGPGEMPPALANRLRRLDRDGNGWVDDNDFDRR